MLLRVFSQKRVGVALALLVLISIALSSLYLHPASYSYISDQTSNWRPHSPPATLAPTKQDPPAPDATEPTPVSTSPVADVDGAANSNPDDAQSPSFPPDYSLVIPQPSFCETRFSEQYLLELHRHKTFQGATKKFHLDCPLRTLAKEETDAGLIPFNKIRGYWYETGPAQILSRAVDLNKYVPPPVKDDGKATAKRQDDAPPPDDAVAEEASPSVTPQSGSTPSALAYPKRPPPKNFLLLKREGETNPWHCLMEIYSSYMAMDVLRMSRDQDNKPFFRAPEDVNDTQVVILDAREDGPVLRPMDPLCRQPQATPHEGTPSRPCRRGRRPRRQHHYPFSQVAAICCGKTTPTSRRSRTGGHLEKRDNWHTQDIVIEEARFVDVVEAAVRSMYSKGTWNYDVNVHSG
ncbi:DUF563 domain-containing protein [Verticillium alfalfae VaMs.102]|uniref:DUF563 domain-containing protein n=1 Tax=Verticillium alfalfae (strain VaMs.102 / ATCC MYA-4576 / FGSC 10136) TaxID=526221 RepID=C9SMY2_VERA1|nr:DUF563 domain-containing protein [Verticillium alfalfae VaMs.102]EEY20147.1 DUF563 domain-containing protein [Verticillium alfalfae VaMs.102]